MQKKYFKKLIGFTLSLTLYFSSYAEITTIKHTSNENLSKINEYNTKEAEQLNHFYAAWKTELNSLISGLQHLSQLVNSKRLKPHNQTSTFLWLQKMSELIGKLNKVPYAPMSTEKLASLYQANQIIIQIINDSLATKLNSHTDVEKIEQAVFTLINESSTQEKKSISFDELKMILQITTYKIEELNNQIKTCGLTWYNQTYTKLSQINREFQITQWIARSAVAALLGSICMRLAPKNWFKHNTNGQPASFAARLKQKIGDTDPHDNQWLSARVRIEVLAGTLGMLSSFNQQFEITKKLSQIASQLDAWLRGTKVKNYEQVQIINDLTLDDPMFDCVRELFGPFNNILKFLEDPEKYTAAGMNVEKCILLTGTPGSGKTLSARALSGSINELLKCKGIVEKCGFITVNAWDDFQNIVDYAKENAPCVIFIDELHLYHGGQQIDSNALSVSLMLQKLDEISKNNDPDKQIFVLGATNRPDLLATALLREGRFGKSSRIEFPVPSLNQREKLLAALCQKSAVDTNSVDIHELALLTQGAAFSTLSKIFHHASFLAKNEAIGITQKHLYHALNTVMRGISQKVELNDADKKLVATHMAGIALAHLSFETANQLESITIQPIARTIKEKNQFVVIAKGSNTDLQHIAEYGAYFTKSNHIYTTESHNNPYTSCKLLIAGSEAQKALLGSSSNYRAHEIQEAYVKAEKVLLNGLKIDDLSKAKQDEIKDQAFNVIQSIRSEVAQFFAKNKEKVQMIADLLMQNHFVTAQEIKDLLANRIDE